MKCCVWSCKCSKLNFYRLVKKKTAATLFTEFVLVMVAQSELKHDYIYIHTIRGRALKNKRTHIDVVLCRNKIYWKSWLSRTFQTINGWSFARCTWTILYTNHNIMQILQRCNVKIIDLRNCNFYKRIVDSIGISIYYYYYYITYKYMFPNKLSM